jgi:hypothetical protein
MRPTRMRLPWGRWSCMISYNMISYKIALYKTILYKIICTMWSHTRLLWRRWSCMIPYEIILYKIASYEIILHETNTCKISLEEMILYKILQDHFIYNCCIQDDLVQDDLICDNLVWDQCIRGCLGGDDPAWYHTRSSGIRSPHKRWSCTRSSSMRATCTIWVAWIWWLTT